MALQAISVSAERRQQCLFAKLNFQLQAGEYCQVVGANGAGKTTLLRILAGLLPPSDGKVLWCGQNIFANGWQLQRDLFYVGHQLGIKNELSAYENLRYDLRLSTYNKQAYQAALAELGLSHVAESLAQDLSQGQRARMAFAKLLLAKARIYILDEPFAVLDQAILQKVQTLLHTKLKEGACIVLTSHRALTLATLPATTINLNHDGTL